MTGFDHLAPGTSEQEWARSGWAPMPGPQTGSRVVVLAAHPDDETLGAGGVIAACHRRGIDVRVVVATDGEASHPHSPSHDPATLGALRRHEVRAALDVLAPGADVEFLGLPDGRVADAETGLAERLAGCARGATHLLSPWRGDRHPDHEALARAASVAAHRLGAVHWQYPIWAWHWAEPDTDDLPREHLRALSLTSADHDRKRRAVACHVSQHLPLSAAPGDEAILPPPVLAHFQRDVECFVIEPAADATDPAYFDRLYGAADDPWGLADRFYERRKRALLLAALPRARFRRAFEPGCATGLLSVELARRCDEVVAWDGAEQAVRQTQARVAGAAVAVRRARIPDDWPDGELDLVVLCEVGYYIRDLDVLVARVLGSLAEDGVVVACHWRRAAPDHPHTAEQVHERLGSALRPFLTHVEDDFLLDGWSRTGRSVATDEGIVT